MYDQAGLVKNLPSVYGIKIKRKDEKMRLASIKPDDLAVVRNGHLLPIGEVLAQQGALPRGASMIDLIARYDAVKDAISKAVEKGSPLKLDPQKLKPPVERPSKIWAAATNYKRGSTGLDDARGRGTAGSATPEEILERTFLKPPSAIVGPEEDIIVPKGGGDHFSRAGALCRHRKKIPQCFEGPGIRHGVRLHHHPGCYRPGVRIGEGDGGSRCVRKGFETFAPIGPWITTKDEIKDPHNLMMRLWVNDEIRQSAKTDAMVNDIAVLVSYLSQVSTLYPGDLIATGNPDAPAF